ncbi:unnamed protein product [Protopolystoma xenopodis]|uniref:MARVEL domain-containing protein n=1 Tax=Protopolystoma xenopodis TaxID=117903 RepID=A0A3S5BX50_9PLAT|nr:unnamed protein product [Protopolystoma xenopodis]
MLTSLPTPRPPHSICSILPVGSTKRFTFGHHSWFSPLESAHSRPFRTKMANCEEQDTLTTNIHTEYGLYEAPAQRPKISFFKTALCLSLLFALVGSIVFILEVVTITMSQVHESFYVGFWSGLSLLLAGCSGLVLLHQLTNAWAMLSMVTDTIAIIGCVIGAVFAWLGRSWPLFLTPLGLVVELRPLQFGVLIADATTAFLVTFHMLIVVKATCACCRRASASIVLTKA